MAVVAISPTGYLGGMTVGPSGMFNNAGSTYGASAASFTCTGNNGLLLLYFVIGSSGTGTLQFTCPIAANQPAAITVANSGTYFFGPFDPAIYNTTAGLLGGTLAGASGTTIAAYYLPARYALQGMDGMHNPFETTPFVPDW